MERDVKMPDRLMKVGPTTGWTPAGLGSSAPVPSGDGNVTAKGLGCRDQPVEVGDNQRRPRGARATPGQLSVTAAGGSCANLCCLLTMMSLPPPTVACGRWESSHRGLPRVRTLLAGLRTAAAPRPGLPRAARRRSDLRAARSPLAPHVTARSSLPKFQPQGGASGRESKEEFSW